MTDQVDRRPARPASPSSSARAAIPSSCGTTRVLARPPPRVRREFRRSPTSKPPSANGNVQRGPSIFQASWTEKQPHRAESLVALGFAPGCRRRAGLSVVRTWTGQFRIIQFVGELTSVPVGRTCCGPSPTPRPIGAPFLRDGGRVERRCCRPDVMPYTFRRQTGCSTLRHHKRRRPAGPRRFSILGPTCTSCSGADQRFAFLQYARCG